MTSPLRPGLVVLHGNRVEDLADAVFAWLGRHPLGVLEEERVLVPSNGMAEWLKMRMAAPRALGVCAAMRVELPARFVWQAWRALLGRDAVPPLAPLDKEPLAWRVMALLPQLLAEPVFAPVAAYLQRGGDAGRASSKRLWQLSERLADLFDQYQVYRGDWLHVWGQGLDRFGAQGSSLPERERWQPRLWRELLNGLAPHERGLDRPALQRRFLQILADAAPAEVAAALPRRLVLFGSTQLPQSLLETLAALARHMPVLLAVPNPCRWHWADLIDNPPLPPAAHQRHGLRRGIDIAGLPPEQRAAAGHPLLAAWGRQARDFVRALDAFDDTLRVRAELDMPRVDLFDTAAPSGGTWLEQVQAHIREGTPLAEHPAVALDPADRSIVMHSTHGPVRELEVLHDQLLGLFAQAGEGEGEDGALNPRDVVVMVPDIEAFAPAIRAVFGALPPDDPRFIPYGITDLGVRAASPLLAAVEWLLAAPHQRHGASELRALLEVPALARRFGLAAGELPTLVRWCHDAGLRWGLNAAQREQASPGLAAAGDTNSWTFGLRRMLLGYAVGDAGPQARAWGPDAGVQPLGDVGGLAAASVGALAELLATLEAWNHDALGLCSPAAWAERLRGLLHDFFDATDDAERAALGLLDEALASWLEATALAGFDTPLPLTVVREAWLQALAPPGRARRFRAGGVTFCTLLPLRAIPFEVVCLLGMNHGEYPRATSRSDFDLMALPGQARPGDRSRRDDDRQLMLDALLAARRVLYVSWAGRNVRDNSVQPPSVLVDRLRDYLRAGWGESALAARLTEHPLQPFSRRYFERVESGGLHTYASAWRALHAGTETDPNTGPALAPGAAAGGATAILTLEPNPRELPPLDLRTLHAFLRRPVEFWFEQRLQVRLDDAGDDVRDDETFDFDALELWSVHESVLQDAAASAASTATSACALVGRNGGIGSDPLALDNDDGVAPPLHSYGYGSSSRLVLAADGGAAHSRFPRYGPPGTDPASGVATLLRRLAREGRLPLAAPGRHASARLQAALRPVVAKHLELGTQLGVRPTLLRLHVELPGAAGAGAQPADRSLVLHDSLGVWPAATPGHADVALSLQASRVLEKNRKPRVSSLLRPWLAALAASAHGRPTEAWVVAPGGWVRLAAAEPAAARACLQDLVHAWQHGATAAAPWPTALHTGLAWLAGKPEQARKAFAGDPYSPRPGEVRSAAMARLFPDFDTLLGAGLAAASERLYGALHAAAGAPLHVEPIDSDPSDDIEGDSEGATPGEGASPSEGDGGFDIDTRTETAADGR